MFICQMRLMFLLSKFPWGSQTGCIGAIVKQRAKKMLIRVSGDRNSRESSEKKTVKSLGNYTGLFKRLFKAFRKR